MEVHFIMSLGNIIVGQSGGPTSVINSSLAGVFKTALDMNEGKVYGMLNGIDGLLHGQYIDMTERMKNDLDVELLKRTPSSFLGSCRRKVKPEDYDDVFKILNELEIGAFFYIGGNDSMDTIKQLSAYGNKIGSPIRFMGVPKTIDNDLAVTDHTPGYGSAAKYIGSTLKEVIRDGLVYSHATVSVVEIMGRDAGWLTLAASLAKGEDCEGVDLIYLPEVPFDLDKFVAKVKELHAQKGSLVIAVSEGIHTADGKYVCEMSAADRMVDSFGHVALSGTASYLSNLLASELGCKTRAIEFSTMQRCANHIASLTDINEAYAAGAMAVEAAAKGETGKVVIFKRVSTEPYIMTTETYDVNAIANEVKNVPLEWIINDGTGISDEAVKYLRPLIAGELQPIMVNGLPRHITVKDC